MKIDRLEGHIALREAHCRILEPNRNPRIAHTLVKTSMTFPDGILVRESSHNVRINWAISSGSVSVFKKGAASCSIRVLTAPGAMQFTRIPYSAPSTAKHSVRPTTANFDAV